MKPLQGAGGRVRALSGIFPPLLGEGKGGVQLGIHPFSLLATSKMWGRPLPMANIKYYSPETVRRSRMLRNNPTQAEKILWGALRSQQMEGYKFRRQFFIGQYITDFVCVDKKLVVEADGGQHCNNTYDAVRDEYIKSQGYTVLRFWNNEIIDNKEGVLQVIRTILLQTPPQPSPKRGGGKAEVAV